MKHIFLMLCLVSAPAIADTASVKLEKKNDKPVSNVRLNITDGFRLDSNTVVTEKSLATGKYESDVGAIYKFTPVDSIRVSATEKNNTMSINYRHKF